MAYYETWEYPVEQATPQSYEGGCLPYMAIPPLAVLAISVVLFFALSNLPFASIPPVQASAVETSSQAADSVNSSVSKAIGNSKLADFFTPEVRYWEPKIIKWAKQWDLDPNLVATVMQIESCGDPQATSSAGAAGLFQVMPFHFSSGEDFYDPQTNARRGLSYLQRSLQSHGGDPRLALAGYNGGIGGSQKPESLWPAETTRYAYWGSGIYEDTLHGKSQSPRLEEWLSAGGASLCTQANQQLGLNS